MLVKEMTLEEELEFLRSTIFTIKFDQRLSKVQVYALCCRALGIEAEAVKHAEETEGLPCF